MGTKGRRAHLDERAHMFVGTTKGAFVYESDFDREKWKRTGPFVAGHAITSIAYDHRDGKTVYVASDGDGLHRTRDNGRTWEKIGAGLPSGRLSHVTIGHLSEAGAIWVGASPAALAVSRDEGASFEPVEGFARCPGVDGWRSPIGPAVVSSIVPSPDSPDKLHVSVRGGGVYRTGDGGASWSACNQGLPAEALGVHRLVSNPARPERLYAVTDVGVFRTDDDGVSWRDVSHGLASRINRSIMVSPSHPGRIVVVPLAGGTGEPPTVKGGLAVYRSFDGGDSWDRLLEGLPEECSATVHPEAMSMDTLDEEGMYLGTSEGSIYVSLDDGETWNQVVSGLAPVLCLEPVAEQQE